MKKKYVVYMHTNKINNKKYIGITCQNPKNRWGGGSHYKKSTYFASAIQKYGWDNFLHEILFDNLTEYDAKQKEIELIAFYHTNEKQYGYNLTTGGQGTRGYHHTDESKKVMRIKRLGSKGYWTGKHLSGETKEKLSASHKGKNFGIPRNEDVKRKISESHKKNGKNKKPVIQFDITTGDVIKKYDSALSAAKAMGTHSRNISKACLGYTHTCCGYKWQYA